VSVGPHGRLGSDPDYYRRLATDKLEELLGSSSQIAALGAAKELLNRPPNLVESEPGPAVARRGADLVDVVATAIACGVVDADEFVREAKMRAQALESS
jgi:hypothetical protein